MRIRSDVVEKLGDIMIGKQLGFRVYTRQGIKYREHGIINSTCVEKKSAYDLLNAGFTRCRQEW